MKQNNFPNNDFLVKIIPFSIVVIHHNIHSSTNIHWVESVNDNTGHCGSNSGNEKSRPVATESQRETDA